MKTILITGATSGIGLETARQLAAQGHELVLHGRNLEKSLIAKDKVLSDSPGAVIHTSCADFSDLAEVARMAAELSRQLPRLDVLINNAGVYKTRCEYSSNGFEMNMAVNHLAHFLLTELLMGLLEKSAAPRVITVSSAAHRNGHIDFSNLSGEIDFEGGQAYANSKLANALFSAELARRVHWLTSNCLHPGVIETKLLRAISDVAGDSVQTGARTLIYLAVSPEVDAVTGKFFYDRRITVPSASVNDPKLAQQLWRWSEASVAK